MSPSLSSQRRSSSRQAEAGTPGSSGGPAALLTTFLLAIILVTGPLVLGANRLWIEMPLLGGVALLLLIQGLRLTAPLSPGALRQADAIDLSVALFVLYALARWLTSPTEYFSRIEAMEVVAYAGVFFTCRYGIARRAHGLTLLFLLVALGTFETGFGYYLSCHLDWFPFGTTERLQLHYAPRWIGTYGCPNHYGSLLVMATGAALSLGCFSKLPWPLRIILFYLAGMMMIGVMYSISRGSWLSGVAAIIALVIFGLRYGTVRWWIPITGALLLLLTAASVAICEVPAVQERVTEFENLFQAGNLNAYVRIQLAEDALRIAHDHPIFGTGPGTFVFIHPHYQSSTFAYKAVLTHDDYLNCLDDYGLVGFGLAMFFVAAVTLKFFQPLRSDQRWPDRVMVSVGFAAWAALLVHSLVDFNLHIPANALLLFALTGLGLGRLKPAGIQHWSTVSFAAWGPWFGRTVILLSLIYGIQVGRTAAGDIAYEKVFAHALEVPTSESIKGAEAALKFDRGNAKDWAFLGDLYRYDASRQQQIEDRIRLGQKALDAYQQALRANPLDQTLEARMGMTFDVMKRYSEAFFCYKTAATMEPYNGQYWFLLGNHYWERGLLEKAEQAYLTAEQCPHGTEGSAEAESELRALPEMKDVPMPTPDTNPLEIKSPTEEPPTIP